MSSTVTQTKPLLVTDTHLMKAKIQVGLPNVRIIYEDYDDISVQYELDNFNLKDFDYFVKQRFQIAEGTALKYSQNLEGTCEWLLQAAFYTLTTSSTCQVTWVPCSSEASRELTKFFTIFLLTLHLNIINRGYSDSSGASKGADIGNWDAAEKRKEGWHEP